MTNRVLARYFRSEEHEPEVAGTCRIAWRHHRLERGLGKDANAVKVATAEQRPHEPAHVHSRCGERTGRRHGDGLEKWQGRAVRGAIAFRHQRSESIRQWLLER